jgi:4-azaleucine resistance transporter AzlC
VSRPPRSELALGVRESLPLGLALIPIGIAFGYVAQKAGLDWWIATLMATVVYAGPSQFLAVDSIMAGAGTAAIVATTLVANLRYVLFSTSLVPYMRDAPPARLVPLAHSVADGSYALTLAHCRCHPERPRKDLYLFGSFLVSAGFWVPATAVGGIVGSDLPRLLSYGLDFATPAIFTALLVPLLRLRLGALAALVGGAGAVLGNQLLRPGLGPLVAILGGASLAGVLEWGRERASS